MSKKNKNSSSKTDKAIDSKAAAAKAALDKAEMKAAIEATKQQQKSSKQAAALPPENAPKNSAASATANADSSAAASPESTTKGKLGAILNCSVISVMRALGAAGWDFKKIQAAVRAQGIEAAERTIRGAIRRGKAGQKRIAVLSPEQLASLEVKAA
jgi:hypothetical protein